MDTLSGAVERITYYNPENGYTVLRLHPEATRAARSFQAPRPGTDGLVTVVGNLPELSPGEHVSLQGRWDKHPKHGFQFKAEVCEQSLPATVSGIQAYLGSGLVKGIGPVLAERIVTKFRESTFDVIEEDPGRLLDVPGIGRDRVQKITVAWQEQKQVKEIMVFLHGHGVSTNLAVKIYKTYGDAALETVQKNPYQLERDIYGIGFKTADKIAQALGLAADHPSRIEAGVIYALNEMIDDGHVFAPREQLCQRAVELLGVPVDQVLPALDRLAEEDRIRADMVALPDSPADAPARGVHEPSAEYRVPVLYLTPLYFGERGVAARLRKLSEEPVSAKRGDASELPSFDLSREQWSALEMALANPVSILTGGPGTGKTTCLQALIAVLEAAGKRYALASPTGRAAKRLSEATGRTASTIHRLLEFSPAEGFKRNEERPLEIDFLIVDEASMLDLLLMHNLLKALRPGMQLLIVGDVDQLPSVGAGDVLRDLIESAAMPVTRLNTIFRQAAGSQIITNAHLINQGKMPAFSKEQGDFYLFPVEEAAEAADWIVRIVSERVPQKFGYDPVRDIQALAPLYRGPAGVTALNERLQEKLNPPSFQKPERKLFGVLFRLGDKVMQTQNNYDKDVYNGDIGFVQAINAVEQTLTVDFEGRRVLYDWSEADQLTLAYVISVHKAQGSEFPVVVMPVVTQHYTMLQRNLLYTAITRARKLCVLSGSRRAISIAVRNNKVTQRYTALGWRLQDGRQ